MRLYVVRHGVTEWNLERRVQGIRDIPLLPEGISMARRTGEALKEVPFDLCYSSPLLRAMQTAEAIIGDRSIPLIRDKRLCEINFGELEGTRLRDENGNVVIREMELFFEDPAHFPRPRGGESIADVLDRTRSFWEEITAGGASDDRTVLISSHGCAVRALLQNVYRDPEHFWHGSVPKNCSVNIVDITGKGPVLVLEDHVFACAGE